MLIACIGGGSNALGLFHEFLDDSNVEMIAVEAAGHGINTDKHAASLTGGKPVFYMEIKHIYYNQKLVKYRKHTLFQLA